MVLVIGGSYQGKTAFAQTLNEDGSRSVWNAFHEWVKEQLTAGTDLYEALAKALERDPQQIIICNELGAGIVPVDPIDRDWRETTGRLCCELAKQAEAVYRVNCGIGIRIK